MNSKFQAAENSSSLPRVLIVENDPDYRKLYEDLLILWKYQPFVVEGEGEELLKNAIISAHQLRCQLAIVDMRLLDNDDSTDFSGLNLVPELKPTQSIIVSAFGDHKAAVTSLTIKGAFSFVGKEDGPKLLKERLDQAAQKYCACVRDLKVYPKRLSKQIFNNFYPRNIQIPIDEVVEMLARLFPGATHIHIDKIDHNVQFILTRVPRPRSIILIAHEDNFQPVVVKLARYKKIVKEIKRYQDYIENRLVGNFSPPLKKWEVLWDLGAMVYPFLGTTSVRTFARYYADASSNEIENSLQRLFRITWSNLYTTTKKDKKKVSVFDAYCDVWDRDWYDERLISLSHLNPISQISHIYPSLTIIDPITWLIQKVDEKKGFPKTSFAVTHGDLHGDNMLVDEYGNVWVIDFERSGFGPVLQDFIELEADIVNRLVEIEENDYHSLYELSKWALTPKSLCEVAPIKQDNPPSLVKAMHIMAVLRQLAFECTHENDAQQYYYGLLFNALFRATLLTHKRHEHSFHRALMFAGMLAYRLENWDEPWPPSEWPNL
jgi:DNA-binding NarL/FixJ family response regulator